MKIIQYLHRLGNMVLLAWYSQTRTWKMLLYMKSLRTLWLTKDQILEFHVAELEKLDMTHSIRLMKAICVGQKLFACEVPDIFHELFGPIYSNQLDMFTPLRYKQAMRILGTDASDIEMFIRIYTEGALPTHRRLYLKSTGAWDEVVRDLLESKRRHVSQHGVLHV